MNSRFLTHDGACLRNEVFSRTAVAFLKLLTSATLTLAVATLPSVAQAPSVGQLYSYTVKDKPSFEEGYRRHLSWHAATNDQLVWYAWTIESGPRKGSFIDGTFGAAFYQLDARPDPKGDGADFVRNVSPYVAPLDVETWTLWPAPSIATPLEDRKPGTTIDVFFLQVEPGEMISFEAAVERLAAKKRNSPPLTWYKVVHAADASAYVLMLTRANFAELESAGSVLVGMLRTAYGTDSAQLENVLKFLRSFRSETWSYQPRLALIPGRALEP